MAGFLSWIVLAQADAGAPNPLIQFIPTALLIMLLWVVLIQRPQKREREARQKMIETLKKNDRVVTTSGIFGVVTNVQHDIGEVTLRIDETNNTRIRVQEAAIHRVISDEPPAEKSDKDNKDKD